MIIRLPYYKHKINIFNLFNKKRHPFFLLIKKRGEIMKSRFFNINRLNCLSKNDVITARISDHQPVIYQDILFWNIMMQCKKRQLNQKIVGYNNGFGFVENQSQYHLRLVKIAIVIAEILYYQPNIHIIGLCEGPILKEDQVLFFKTLKIFSHLERFVSSGQFNHPNESNADKWGLLMLADKKFSVIAKKELSFPKNAKLFVIIVAILETAAFLSIGAGISHEYTSIVYSVASAFPAVTIILAMIFFKETIELSNKMGAISVLAGLVLLAI